MPRFSSIDLVYILCRLGVYTTLPRNSLLDYGKSRSAQEAIKQTIADIAQGQVISHTSGLMAGGLQHLKLAGTDRRGLSGELAVLKHQRLKSNWFQHLHLFSFQLRGKTGPLRNPQCKVHLDNLNVASALCHEKQHQDVHDMDMSGFQDAGCGLHTCLRTKQQRQTL